MREYYANVARAVLRSYAMSQLAFMLTTLSGHESRRNEAELERNLYTTQFKAFRATIGKMLNAASRDLWKCNPNPYLNSSTFGQYGLARNKIMKVFVLN